MIEPSTYLTLTHLNEASTPQGVLVLIHGLNLKPNCMDALASMFAEAGYSSFRVALHGHRGKKDEMSSVTRKIWLAECEQAFHQAEELAHKLNVPLYFLGYSLGGLVGLDFIHQVRRNPFKKMILLAPALALQPVHRLISLLFFLKNEVIIPGLTPFDYAANAGTSMAAYRAILESKFSLYRTHFKLANTPTLVMLDRKDELISYRKIENLRKRKKLTEWYIEPIDSSNSEFTKKFSHLIVDSKCLGRMEWKRLCERLVGFLND